MAFFDAPRGKRNNNPFNIDYQASNLWDGQIGIEPKSPDGTQRFAAFADTMFGARAFFKLLSTYKNKHKIKTIRKMINRFAPPNENDTEAYIAFVAEALGVEPDAKIDLTDEDTAKKIAAAKVKFENGVEVSDVIDEATLDRAHKLATGSRYTKEEKLESASRKKGDLSETMIKSILSGSSGSIEEGDVLTAPLVDIEGEVRAAIQAQLAQQNVAPAAPEELSEVLTPEEEAMLSVIESRQASRQSELDASIQREDEFLSQEEEAMLRVIAERANLGVVQEGPAVEEPEQGRSEQDLIEEIF